MSDDEEDYPTAGAGLDDEEVGLPKSILESVLAHCAPCPCSHGSSEKNKKNNHAATIAKIIQEVLPNDLWCAKETRDLITDCCLGGFDSLFNFGVTDPRMHSFFSTEFVHLISSEANEECEKESKKTITGEHVLAALRSLGFEDYITEVNGALDDHNKLSKERRKRSTKFDNSGISAEEKLRRQEALIEQARLNMMNGMTGEPN
ncbi:TATA binding protein-associated phosphoprotein [Chytriomyces cf. hyalinus JEL632]|nr:TATA binding protein-associated phosphoprotein [Chytriomyces cf. hyalinus JEL632]